MCKQFVVGGKGNGGPLKAEVALARARLSACSSPVKRFTTAANKAAALAAQGKRERRTANPLSSDRESGKCRAGHKVSTA